MGELFTVSVCPVWGLTATAEAKAGVRSVVGSEEPFACAGEGRDARGRTDGRTAAGKRMREGERGERERTSTYVQGSAVTEFDKLLCSLEG